MEILGRKRRRKIKSPPRARSRGRHGGKQWAWWDWGDNLKGKRVALGPWNSQHEADARGISGYPGDFKTYYLDTVNMARAKQILKAKDLEDGRTIDEAMNRASSELP